MDGEMTDAVSAILPAPNRYASKTRSDPSIWWWVSSDRPFFCLLGKDRPLLILLILIHPNPKAHQSMEEEEGRTDSTRDLHPPLHHPPIFTRSPHSPLSFFPIFLVQSTGVLPLCAAFFLL